MGVRILAGVYEDGERAAVMVDTTTGAALAPVFTGEDADEQAWEFAEWIRMERWRDDLTGIFGRSRPQPRGSGNDPGGWAEFALLKLARYWRVMQEARVAEGTRR